jgi:CHASE2 domain-containing sensor protein
MERRAFRIGDKTVGGGELLERGSLAALSALAAMLPILDVNSAGATDGILLHDFRLLGAAAYLLSVAYAAGLFGLFAHSMREHMRFVDLAGLIMVIVAVSRAAYMVGWSVVPVMPTAGDGNLETAQLAEVHLAYGSVPLLLLLLGSMGLLRRSWRG